MGLKIKPKINLVINFKYIHCKEERWFRDSIQLRKGRCSGFGEIY